MRDADLSFLQGLVTERSSDRIVAFRLLKAIRRRATLSKECSLFLAGNSVGPIKCQSPFVNIDAVIPSPRSEGDQITLQH